MGAKKQINEAIQTKEQKDMEIILTIIHENYHNITNTAVLERATGFTETECTKLFRKYLKMTPMEYIRRYRVKTVCHLLENTDLSVTEISDQCGMNTSYLCKMVRDNTGYSPLDYRRNHWRNQVKNNF